MYMLFLLADAVGKRQNGVLHQYAKNVSSTDNNKKSYWLCMYPSSKGCTICCFATVSMCLQLPAAHGYNSSRNAHNVCDKSGLNYRILPFCPQDCSLCSMTAQALINKAPKNLEVKKILRVSSSSNLNISIFLCPRTLIFRCFFYSILISTMA